MQFHGNPENDKEVVGDGISKKPVPKKSQIQKLRISLILQRYVKKLRITA